MKINAGNAQSLSVSAGNNEVSSAASNTADASWFSAALQSPAKPASSDNQSWINKVTSLSETASGHANQADRALAKVSRSLDSQSVMAANRTLSSYYLESLLNAKLVGKGVQSLEKLTNLQ
ncbi:EscI/YscI/HrpB family type III secretion system inner rod protein [Erwinia amylovora]|uniref:Type III secretion protein HrpB n=4 Tax=Erwinia amylovora TaxID=552 RepID=A0A831A3B5_ERWAM|nr:EscI/YscI/HrpB family type III secretion system inner rod protein [Erwinia amylovora]CBX79361.1 type III secretion protein HrpB [Erwinia amylovora ATCC BAA-2158]CCP01838.1 type III secretion protein HrpB [Erwinia amylovora Ea644]CCP05862.1 type III secretion protein HrpB [Erwinia amylovora MR1]CDK14142.1 type III secretion protein HrpB [Erwinia amylovora LA635]CDK17509.1 type III secretion protein HrpB [Erwinia amylovora LA636]CDK20878.1 type III secretion protein HrpB [Erwinia amylovora L